MTDNLDHDVSRGKQAAALLGNELLTEAFDTLRAEYLKAWEATGARDTDARERLWQAYQIAGKIRTQLNSVVSNGNLAQAEIDGVARLGERKKIFGVV